MLALVLLAGCHRCQDWADLAVEDPDGLATADDLAGIAGGIADMAAWTARDETCVEEVRVVEELFDGEYPLGGLYDAPRIEMIAGMGEYSSAEVTRHELCHAIDHEEGWISEEHADTLQALADEQDPEIYDSADARTHEAFATLCAEGPVQPALHEALSAACALDLSDPAFELVQELVFDGYDLADDLGVFTHETAWAALGERDGDALGGSVARGGDDVYVLDHAGVEVDGAYQVAPELLRVDPSTGAVAERLALDPHPPFREVDTTTYWRHALIGSSADPILYSAEGAWRVRPDPLRLEPLEFPRLDRGALPSFGFEHHGLAYVYVAENGRLTLALADLAAGTLTPVAADEVDRFYGFLPYALFADEEGAVAAFEAPDGMVLVGLGWDAVVAWVEPLLGEEDRDASVLRLGDGTILAVTHVWVMDDDGGDSPYPLPVLYDPRAETWRIPDGDCGGDLASEGWVVVGDRVVRSWPDERDGTYVLEWGELALE